MRTELVRQRIKDMGLTQRRAARYMGISENTLCRKLRTGLFRSDEMEMLARLLEVDPQELFFQESAKG